MTSSMKPLRVGGMNAYEFWCGPLWGRVGNHTMQVVQESIYLLYCRFPLVRSVCHFEYAVAHP